jgi:hypothetical protein
LAGYNTDGSLDTPFGTGGRVKRHLSLGNSYLAHAEPEIAAFNARYNTEWLVERHGHCMPREVRRCRRPRDKDGKLSREPGPVQAPSRAHGTG